MGSCPNNFYYRINLNGKIVPIANFTVSGGICHIAPHRTVLLQTRQRPIRTVGAESSTVLFRKPGKLTDRQHFCSRCKGEGNEQRERKSGDA